MSDAPLIYVDTPQLLEKVCTTLANSQWLVIDTEFLRENTYYPEFCLLQLAGERTLACIDPLKIKHLEPLWELLYQPHITKVFHAGRQDLEIFYHLHGRLPQPLFDTQVAAPLLGYPEQIGYANLVSEILGVTLEKGHSRTDWSRRPLSPQQVEYAADDVRYLAPMYLRIREKLMALGRLEWLDEDFCHLSDPATYANPPGEAWRRIKGARKLKGRQLAILRRLAAWREELARQENRPRGWILKDDLLCHIARLKPQTPQALAQLRGLGEKTLKRHGETICRLVNAAASEAMEPLPARPPTLSSEQEALLDLLNAVVRLQAAYHQITPSVLASRKDLELFLSTPNHSRLAQGWRKKLVGNALQDLLEGRKRLAIEKGRLQLEEVFP